MTVKKSDSHFEKRQNHLQTLGEWQNLLEHFELNDNSFAYIPLLLPNDLWARVCENSLENYLSAKGKQLSKIDCQTPEDVKNIAVTLFDLEIDADTEAVWIVAPIGTGEKFLEKWAQAWREGMARLNQYRNPLREKFPVTLLFVGAEWIQEITRNMAPDLWSIRSTIIRLQPKIAFSDDTAKRNELQQSEAVFSHGEGVDPEFALKEAERLRGKKGLEMFLAILLNRAARGLLDQKNYQKALETVEEAIGICEKKIAEETDEMHQAELELQLAESYFTKGFALSELGGFGKEAEENYQKVIDLNPNYAEAYYNLGNLLDEDESRWMEAEAAYRQAIELNPNYANAYYNLGILLGKDESRWMEAEAAYRKAIELNPNLADAYYNLGNLLVKDESRWMEAEAAYRKAIELNPNYAEAYYNLGTLLVKDESRWMEAEAAYRQAIELNPNYANAYNNLGILLGKDESRWMEAEAAYRKAIELNPNLAEAYYNLGNLLGKDESRWTEAEAAFRQAIELNPNDASAYFNLACLRSISRKEENKDEAFEFLRKAVGMDSKYKAMAKTDADFDFIRDDARFAEIVGD